MIKKVIPTLCTLVAMVYAAIAPVQANERVSEIKAIHEQLKRGINIPDQCYPVPGMHDSLFAFTSNYLFTAHLNPNGNLVISTYERGPDKQGKARSMTLLEQYTDVKPFGVGNDDSVIIYNKSNNPRENYGSVPFGKQLPVGICGADFVPGPIYCHRSAAIDPLYRALRELQKNTKK